MNRNFKPKHYASGRARALITILLLGASATLGVLSIILNVGVAGMLRGNRAAPYEFGESVSEALYVGVALLQVAVFIATVAAFAVWLHRAYRNLPALGADKLDTTPAWAVGYFFIPIVNLFLPFRVLKEIWRESAPAGETRVSFSGMTGASFGGDDERAGATTLVGYWWAFWIIANVVSVVSDRVAELAGTIESMVWVYWANVASNALFIVAAVLAILVVKRIDEMQETKFRQLAAQKPPPPPVSFET